MNYDILLAFCCQKNNNLLVVKSYWLKPTTSDLYTIMIFLFKFYQFSPLNVMCVN